jgi:DNA-binding LytR/AlgR family response regulator
LSQFNFIVIDNNQDNSLRTKAVADSFQNLNCVAVAHSYDEGLDSILAKKPNIVFLEINTDDKKSDISFSLINELYRYLDVIPKVIVTSNGKESAYDAIKNGAFDYLLQPIEQKDLRKTLTLLIKDTQKGNIIQQLKSENFNPLKIDLVSKPVDLDEKNDDKVKENKELDYIQKDEIDYDDLINEDETDVDNDDKSEVTFIQSELKEKPLTICVKSYGDYRYINSEDICYLQADNNSTDIHLNNGEMITAFKTLKHFEAVLKYPFVRIHNSYIVNTDYISRIHTGNAVCHIKDTTTKLPFSKSYKENIDQIISTIASGNYLEI